MCFKVRVCCSLRFFVFLCPRWMCFRLFWLSLLVFYVNAGLVRSITFAAEHLGVPAFGQDVQM